MGAPCCRGAGEGSRLAYETMLECRQRDSAVPWLFAFRPEKGALDSVKDGDGYSMVQL
jgi:hypothetical protein